jgi:hypothetical protein
MAKNPINKREDERQVTRRALIKWSLAAGAALGVSRSRIAEVLEKTAGKDVAFAATQSTVNNSLFFEHGNGGLSYLTQMFPFTATATSTATFGTGVSLDPVLAGKLAPIKGSNGSMIYQGPYTPFKSLPVAQQVTAFICGTNTTHNQNGTMKNTLINGADIVSVCAAIQSAGAPTVVPLILSGGTVALAAQAGGAPNPTTVAGPAGFADLFNSAASSATGILAKASDATLYKAQYETFFQLNRVAGLSTTRIGFTNADGAAGLLGTNLSSVLTVTADDLSRYGITSSTQAQVASIGQNLILAIKAMKMGLTSSMYVSGVNDDPHGYFADNGDNMGVSDYLGVLNAFMSDLQTNTDDNTGETLASKTVMTWFGDTFKDPFAPAGWNDGTPSNSSVVYCMGAGYLQTGWYGDLKADGSAMDGFDGNGNITTGTYDGLTQLSYALGSVAAAVARADLRAIETVTGNVNVSAFVNTAGVQTGN